MRQPGSIKRLNPTNPQPKKSEIMTQLCDQFGAVVRRLREKNGWSQEVLADRAGLNRSYLGEIERGSAVPSLTTISKIAFALNVSTSTLIANCEQQCEQQIVNKNSGQLPLMAIDG